MLALDEAEVYIPRGDDASFDIIFSGIKEEDDGRSVYFLVNEIPEDGTPVRFSVKADLGRLKPVIQKDLVIRRGYVTIPLESKDTNCLPFGDYYWDIRLFFKDAGAYDVNTLLLPHGFHVIGVAGNV